jgi:AAA ATPase-like protein
MDRAGQSARSAEMFVGREQELTALTAALGGVSAGEPRFVLIQGAAGIGKSSLISEFLAGQENLPVVTASGEESEAYLPYGLVHQLAASGARISPDALGGLDLLSRGPPRADADPLAVGVELLALISSLQGSDVVAVVIEDLQWMDLASAHALLFAFRRLSVDRVLVLPQRSAKPSAQVFCSSGRPRPAGRFPSFTGFSVRPCTRISAPCDGGSSTSARPLS